MPPIPCLIEMICAAMLEIADGDMDVLLTGLKSGDSGLLRVEDREHRDNLCAARNESDQAHYLPMKTALGMGLIR